MENINFEQISLQIITYAGGAKSLAMEAITACKNNKFDIANEKIKECDQQMKIANKFHFDTLIKSSELKDQQLPILFIHAEDHLSSAETIRLLSLEIIDIYKRIAEKDNV